MGSAPNSADCQDWRTSYGLTHPVLADPSQSQMNYISAYPTFVLIDRNMVIQDPDMWPWSDSAIASLL
jgi:hypothetical protein